MLKDTLKGHWLKIRNTVIFFGKSERTLNELQSEFKVQICQLNQTHSDITLQASPSFQDGFEKAQEQTADGHFTDQPNRALIVKTADCIPLLMYCQDQEFLLAIHAGWRGVASKIAPKALELLNKEYPSLTNAKWKAFIGPHISFENFEVGLDVADQILGTIGLSSSEGLSGDPKILPFYNTFLKKHPESNKCYINLHEVLSSQMTDYKVEWQNTEIDTIDDLEFASYRRNGKSAGRNLSAIFRADHNFDWDKWNTWLNS